MIRFSIIIPLYNKAQYIHATLQSVLAQSYREFEVIVVNDGSTDNSADIVKLIDDERIKLIDKPNGGVSAARNFGIKHAINTYIAFLDADDVWASDHLENMIGLIRDYPESKYYVTAYKCFVNNISNITNIIDLQKYNSHNSFLISDYFEMRVLSDMQICMTSAICIHRGILGNESAFPEGVSCGEDLDLWLRLAFKSPIAYSNIPTMYYQIEATNSLTTGVTTLKGSFKYWDWFNYESGSPYFEEYVNKMIYLLAIKSYKNKNYKEAVLVLCKLRGTYKLHKRLGLIFLSSIGMVRQIIS